MTASKLTAILMIILLGGGTLPAQNPWSQKTPSDWTLEDLEKILWDSPWVNKKRFRFYGSYGSRYRVQFFVRIQSAEPVRLAMAKVVEVLPDRFIRQVGPIDTEKIREKAEELRLPGELVISLVANPPYIHQHLNRHTPGSLTEATTLTVNRKQLHLKRYHPPRTTRHGEALFCFQRPEAEDLKGEMEFLTRVEIPHEVEIKVDFEIEDLIYEETPAY